MTYLLVMLGGAIGAPLRYFLDATVKARLRGAFPLGTLLVNLLGCLILGVLAGLLAAHHTGGTGADGWPRTVQALVGTGFCGGLTTFSTFSVEAVELAQAGRRLSALAYVVLSCALGLGAATGGYALV
jgi:CrcB protein